MSRFFPAGFRSGSVLAGLLLLCGGAQLLTLPGRSEPHPGSAAALALLLLGGGAALMAFLLFNVRERAACDAHPPRSAADLLDALALAAIALVVLDTWRTTGIFFPARMALAWRGSLSFDRLVEPPLPMMLAGTVLVALGAAATAAVAGALWVGLYAGKLPGVSRAIGAALSFAGAVPYVAFALVVRAVLCPPLSLLAAGQWLAIRPDEQLAYRSLLGIAPGLLTAALGLGLGISRGLWTLLEDARAAEESSDSFLAARVRGERAFLIILRHGLWLRRRRELGALLLSGMAAAVLIDVLSNTLIDSFRAPGFPPYPSLGAALFLRGAAAGGAPAELPVAWGTAHGAVVAAGLLLVLAQALPRGAGRISLEGRTLRVAGEVLARDVPSASGLPPRPSLQWVLGPSGAGKSTLLRAWAAQLPRSVLVPQDPDEALPAAFSATDAAAVARAGGARGDRVLWDLLGRLGDAPVRRRLFDPFTSLSTLSRGERQRIVFALALARALRDPSCTLLLDEPTASQDALRANALLACLRDLLPAQLTGTGAIALTSHDPESIQALLGGGTPRDAVDHVLWIEGRNARATPVRTATGWRAIAPEGLQRYLGAVDALVDANGRPANPAPRAGGDGVQVLRSRVSIAGRGYAVSSEARVRGGELVLLSGASGSGKSTLLREIARRPPAAVQVGFVMQDAARVFPLEMPVREVLGEGAEVRRDLLCHWFGAMPDGALLSRSVGALSEGERQRILLASEVVRLEKSKRRTRLLLLDEPFGAVDPAAHLRLMEELLSWVSEPSRRNSAVLVSHSPRMDLGLARAFGVPTREWTIRGEDR